ncbi:CYTH domain-containing protein [Alkalicoccobacillus murimartini]|uniref:Uncharacterized protein YjbK n=1 Tax=Alkalicoccobacillus murimartini TaxID=171685 RepID=A0ABT9YLH6_9BACI|nr:CYTH domain-containing protein [Alkalicoccobacillus murimartini]MDQ0207884.1 uncharacterized protein YjbK [Alkalicoccobacillus murimartini]
MSQEFEYEAKSLLSLSDFSTLIHHLKLQEHKAITQHNHYFETPDSELSAAGSALRIREKNDKAILTLKQPSEDGGLLETHQVLTEKEKEEALANGTLPNGQTTSQLNSLLLAHNQLSFLGTLTTERIEVSYQDGSLCLDKSSYLGDVDYEVEFEGSSMKSAHQTLTSLLNEVGISPMKTPNKVARFFMRKAAQNN